MAAKKSVWKTLASWKTFFLAAIVGVLLGAAVSAVGFDSAGTSVALVIMALGLLNMIIARFQLAKIEDPTEMPEPKKKVKRGTKFEDAEDPIAWLRSCDARGQFVNEISLFEKSYDSAKGRDLYYAKFDSDSPFKRSYDLVITQMKSDIKSAGQFIGTYYPTGKADRSYLHALLKNTRELAAKLDELTKAAISNESVADDVDTSYVDDLLDSVKELQNQSPAQM